MSPEQKDALKVRLKNGEYTTAKVGEITREEFCIEYTMIQVWVILKKMGMRYAEPYPQQ